MSVRRATAIDLDTVAVLSVGIQSLHRQARPDLFKPADVAALRGVLVDRVARGAILLVSESGGVVVGYLLAELIERSENAVRYGSTLLYVNHIAVDPRSQHRGHGSQLLAEAMSIGRDLDVEAVRLDSWSFNAEAHAFFEREGFEPLDIVFERRLSDGIRGNHDLEGESRS